MYFSRWGQDSPVRNQGRQKTLNGFISPPPLGPILYFHNSFVVIFPIFFPPWFECICTLDSRSTSNTDRMDLYRLGQESAETEFICVHGPWVLALGRSAMLYTAHLLVQFSTPQSSLRPHFQNGVGVSAPQSSIMCFVVNSHRLPSSYRSVYLQFPASKCVSRSPTGTNVKCRLNVGFR